MKDEKRGSISGVYLRIIFPQINRAYGSLFIGCFESSEASAIEAFEKTLDVDFEFVTEVKVEAGSRYIFLTRTIQELRDVHPCAEIICLTW